MKGWRNVLKYVLCQWLEAEGDADLYTLAELHSKMSELSGESEVYTIKRLKQKLQERYKEFIFFAEVEGRSNVVYFRNMAKYIINDKWYSERVYKRRGRSNSNCSCKDHKGRDQGKRVQHQHVS